MSKRFVLGFLILTVACAGGGIFWAHQEQHTTSLNVLDIGQGDSILFRHGSMDMLVDGGPDSSVVQALGGVRPFWDRRIEILVLTHPQQDHMRGFLDIVDREDVGLVLLPAMHATSETFKGLVRRLIDRGIPAYVIEAGDEFRHGDLHVRVLAPDGTLLERAQKNPNHGAVVLRVDTPAFSTLLTADIEAPTEQYLLKTAGSLLDVDVFKVPHHGSKTSSTASFLRAVSPMLSMISCGRNNRYGHPHEMVVRRYAPTSLARTDRHGTVSLISRANQLFLRCARGCGEVSARK